MAVAAGVSPARRAQRTSFEWNGGFAAGAGETPAATGLIWPYPLTPSPV